MGRLVELICDIGDHVYEIISDDIGKEVCLDRYVVQDISIKAVKFCDEWKALSLIDKSIFFNSDNANKAFQEMNFSSKYTGYKFFINDNEV